MILWGPTAPHNPEFKEGDIDNSWTGVTALVGSGGDDIESVGLWQSPIEALAVTAWCDSDDDLEISYWDGTSWDTYNGITDTFYYCDRFPMTDGGAFESLSGDFYLLILKQIQLLMTKLIM